MTTYTNPTKYKPDLILPIRGNVLQNMFAYAAEAEKQYGSEIAGWAHYTHEKGIYKLAPLLRQEVSHAEVDVFPDAILNDVNYKLDDLIVQWHSHADMNVMWSGTDEANIKHILGLMDTVMSVVVNIYGEYRARLDTKVAGHGNFQFDVGAITTFKVALTPYIKSPKIAEDVTLKLFDPPVVKTKKAKTVYAPKGTSASNSSDSKIGSEDNDQLSLAERLG